MYLSNTSYFAFTDNRCSRKDKYVLFFSYNSVTKLCVCVFTSTCDLLPFLLSPSYCLSVFFFPNCHANCRPTPPLTLQESGRWQQWNLISCLTNRFQPGRRADRQKCGEIGCVVGGFGGNSRAQVIIPVHVQGNTIYKKKNLKKKICKVWKQFHKLTCHELDVINEATLMFSRLQNVAQICTDM